MARSLLTAGVETTVSGIDAAVYCFAHFPEQSERLRAGPGLTCAAFQ